jgi:shikimate kinase
VGKIWLIGMMGSGKTTVAPLVAARLGWRAVDTDTAITAGSGVRSPTGPASRRVPAAERSSWRLPPPIRRLVVACGGGVVLDSESVALMRAGGMVVCLDAPVPVLAVRVGSGTGRPLLGGDAAAGLDAILTERMDLYRAAAHTVVAAGEAPEAVAEA